MGAAGVNPVVLIIYADPDARMDLEQPLFGQPLRERIARTAREAGFARVAVTPSVNGVVSDATEVGIGEEIGQPALLVWEGSYVDPALLRLMIEHPLDPDERFAIYDELGRPAGCFCGNLGAVPALVPVAEELDLPPPFGNASAVRVVDREDLPRAHRLIAQCETSLQLADSGFLREAGLRTLSWLARSRLTLAQLEMLALLLVLASAPLLLLLGWPGLVAAGMCLVGGVHVARLLRALGELVPTTRVVGGVDEFAPGETLAQLVRPVGHAAFIISSTYLLISHVDRSSVAALVLLAFGGSAALLNIARVRHLLRRGAAERLALVRVERLVARLGLRLPSALVQAPLLELVVWVTCLFGEVAVPWALCVAAASTRLWPWFVAPVESARAANPLR